MVTGLFAGQHNTELHGTITGEITQKNMHNRVTAKGWQTPVYNMFFGIINSKTYNCNKQ